MNIETSFCLPNKCAEHYWTKTPQFIQLTFGHGRSRQWDNITRRHGWAARFTTHKPYLCRSGRSVPCPGWNFPPPRRASSVQKGPDRLRDQSRRFRRSRTPSSRTHDTTPAFSRDGCHFDQQPLTEGPTVVVTGTIGAVKRFPFHDIPLCQDRCRLLFEELCTVAGVPICLR